MHHCLDLCICVPLVAARTVLTSVCLLVDRIAKSYGWFSCNLGNKREEGDFFKFRKVLVRLGVKSSDLGKG